MTNTEELAFQVCRYMLENQYTGANCVTASNLRKALDMSPEEFDDADNYLREKKYYYNPSWGEAAQLSLNASGIDFVNRKRESRIDISTDAEQLAKHLAMKQTPNRSFTLGTEIKTHFHWDDNRYWEACQILIDEGLVEVKPRSDNIPLNGLSLNAEGRKAVRRNFQRSTTPTVSVHTGDNITIENTGDNVAIAAGEGASATQSTNNQIIDSFFDEILHQIEQHEDLSRDKKQYLKDAIVLAQDEAKLNEPNEKRLTVYLQNIAMMAPDILEVALTAATALAAGPFPVVLLIARKVSERAKSDAQKHKNG